MNEKVNTWKNPVIAILVLAMVVVAGYFYTTRNRESDTLLTDVSVADQVVTVDGDLLKTLGKLKKLQLDDSVFSDPVWQSLRDFGRTLSSEPKGRVNPFAPLSASGQ